MSDLIEVTQADRDAVQTFHKIMAKKIISDDPTLGEDMGDAGELVQAFAAHRAQAITALTAENERLREALAPPNEHNSGEV